MKKIGLLTDITTDNKISLNLPYFRFAERFGSVTLVHPWESEIIPDLDLLILPGGNDVHPLRYQQVKVPWLCLSQNANYEYFDLTAMPKYIANKTPIFGICRGLQTLNVHFGGSLFQHVDEPHSGMERGKIVHGAVDTRTNEVFGINSLHHQAIDKLGDGFETILYGFKKEKKKKSELLQVEAIKHNELPIFAIQYHVEELEDSGDTQLAFDWTMNEINDIINQGQAIKAAKEVVAPLEEIEVTGI